jgi:hypothetical protein
LNNRITLQSNLEKDLYVQWKNLSEDRQQQGERRLVLWEAAAPVDSTNTRKPPELDLATPQYH